MLSGRDLGCTHAGPYFVASRGPLHFGIGKGGCQRRAPVGGRANGIPLKTRMLPAVSPCIFPAGASTNTGVSATAVSDRQSATRPGAQVRNEITGCLRFEPRASM